MSDIEARVIDIVAEKLGKNQASKEGITANSSFVDDLEADSLDTVELVMGFEEEFDITIKDDKAQEIQTVGDAVKLIEALQKEQAS